MVLSQGEIVVLHRLTTFAPVLGQQTAFNNSCYCFHGDVTNVGQVAVANWPDAAFTPIAGVRVQTLATINGEIAAARTNNAVALGPLGAADAGTELIAVRMACPVPITYAPIIMGRDSWSPFDFWDVVVQQIITDNNNAHCALLVDWAHAALHLRTMAAGNNTSTVELGALTAPLSTPTFLQRVHQWVIADIPLLAPGAAGGGNAALHMQMAATNQQLQALVAATNARANHVKTVTEAFPNTVPTLRHLTGVATDAELPRLWCDLAHSNKSEKSAVITAALQKAALV